MEHKLVIEARRNPKINAKQQSLLGELKQIQSELGKLPNGQTNGFISFFTMHKLGIRPFPSDETTPIGVYAYPLDYVISQFELKNSEKLGDVVPYAGGHPVINILTIKNPDTTFFLSDKNQTKEFVEKVKQTFAKEFPENKNGLEDFSNNPDSMMHPYATYQSVCRHRFNASVAKMSSMLVNMGYTAIFDDTGRSFIAIEPTQIVFLSKSAMGHVTTHVNPHTLHNGVASGDINVVRTFHNNNAGFIKTPPARIIASQIGPNNVKTFHDLVDEIHESFEIPIVKGDYFNDKLEMMVDRIIGNLQEEPSFFHGEIENDFNIYVDRVRWSTLVCANLIKLHDMGILGDQDNYKYYINLHKRLLDTTVFLKELMSALKTTKFKNLAVSEAPINEKTVALADFVKSNIKSDQLMVPSDFSMLANTLGFNKADKYQQCMRIVLRFHFKNIARTFILGHLE